MRLNGVTEIRLQAGTISRRAAGLAQPERRPLAEARRCAGIASVSPGALARARAAHTGAVARLIRARRAVVVGRVSARLVGATGSAQGLWCGFAGGGRGRAGVAALAGTTRRARHLVLTARHAASSGERGAFLANAALVVSIEHLVWTAAIAGVESASTHCQPEQNGEHANASHPAGCVIES